MPTLNLVKNQRLNLTKDNPSLTEMKVGLGWRFVENGAKFDLDVLCIGLNAQNVTPDANWFCYFDNLTAFNGAIVHSGDNRDGQGEGDDETILIKLNQLPAEVNRLVFMACIFNAEPTQNFGGVKDAGLRIYQNGNATPLYNYDLSEDYSVFQNLIVAELVRDGADWKFKTTTQGFNGDANHGLTLL
jgi:tellurium resistance protein TerD